MGAKNTADTQKLNDFQKSITGVEIPILTLDRQWYILMSREERREVEKAQDELNSLIRRQGKLTNEAKALKNIKKKLLSEMRDYADGSSVNEQKLLQNRKLFDEASEKLDNYKDELLDLPDLIKEANKTLMLKTMAVCYRTMKENDSEIAEIQEWIDETRVELKRHLVKKVMMEEKTKNIYSYMHKYFGTECAELFDRVYEE